MFIGHFAVGFACKPLAPRTNLGVLVLAPVFLDALRPPLLAAGIESIRPEPGHPGLMPFDLRDNAWSHSLLMTVVWAALFAGVYFLASRDRRAALVLGAGVLSHWVLDAISHRPDMTLYPGSAVRVGLGL